MALAAEFEDLGISERRLAVKSALAWVVVHGLLLSNSAPVSMGLLAYLRPYADSLMNEKALLYPLAPTSYPNPIHPVHPVHQILPILFPVPHPAHLRLHTP